MKTGLSFGYEVVDVHGHSICPACKMKFPDQQKLDVHCKRFCSGSGLTHVNKTAEDPAATGGCGLAITELKAYLQSEVATGASGFDRRVTMRGDTDPTARAASGTNLEAGYSDSEHDS